MLTDGLKFTAYVLDDGEPGGLREVDALDLEKTEPAVAQSWLDAYLCGNRASRQRRRISCSVWLRSPTFATAAHLLRDALVVFNKAEAGAAEVKRQQWAFYLARVYGSADASNEEMFVRHTYLCQFAKIRLRRLLLSGRGDQPHRRYPQWAGLRGAGNQQRRRGRFLCVGAGA